MKYFRKTLASLAGHIAARCGAARVVRRFSTDEQGTTAVEFGLVAVPFIALMMAILETALVFFAGQALETSVSNAGRLIRTGQAQQLGLTAATFKDLICGQIYYLFDCAGGIRVEVKKYDSFAEIDLSRPTNGAGNLKIRRPRNAQRSWLRPGPRRRHRRCARLLRVADVRHQARQRHGRPGRRQPPPRRDHGVPQRALPLVTAMLSLLRTPLWRPFRRFAKDARGVSAVEFALILPLMLTLYLGGNELTHALTIARKVTHATSSLGDLVTQTKAVSAADMTKYTTSWDRY